MPLMEMGSRIATRGLALPPLGGVQVAAYVDRSAEGFWPVGLWRDRRGQAPGRVWLAGLDAGPLRVRLVLERLQPGARVEWGPL